MEPTEPVEGQSNQTDFEISEEEARQQVDRINPRHKEHIDNPDFLRFLIGRSLFLLAGSETESEKPIDEEDREFEHIRQRGLEENKQALRLFTDLLKGQPLVQAFRTSRLNLHVFIDRVGNTGELYNIHLRYPEDDMLKGESLTMEGGINYSYKTHQTRTEQEKQELVGQRDIALKKAEELEAELDKK